MRESTMDEQELWRRLDWNDVRTFLAVAECGSLNGAARLLGATQPTISRRMEDFEHRLKTRLFERTTRGIMLTEAGMTVRDLAQSMARVGGMILRNVAEHDSRDVGRVRLAAPDGISGFVLAPQLPKFQMANPQVQLYVDCGQWTSGSIEDEPDLFLEMTDAGAPDLASIPVARLHYALFASRDYLDLYGTPRKLSELASHRTVRYTSHSVQRSTWHPKAAAISMLAETHFVSNSSAATFQAVRAGAGIGSLPTYVAPIAPELVMLDIDPWAHPMLFLRHRRGIEHQRRVKLVKEWLMEAFDAADQPWFREEFIHPKDFHNYLDRAAAAPATMVKTPRRRVAG
jgi:DNA-binding transcriptional LysR family regulator